MTTCFRHMMIICYTKNGFLKVGQFILKLGHLLERAPLCGEKGDQVAPSSCGFQFNVDQVARGK